MYLNRRDLIEVARAKVLAALDEFVRDDIDLPSLSAGATDDDLPELFRGIDAQVDRLIERSGFVMPDEPYTDEFLAYTKTQLEQSKLAST